MQNRGEFPRGIDLLLVSGTEVLGLPRTTRITMEAH
jgi:alpha-D-ribose 1-methylphosphonate 5-triphosphate synthase subunit PhnH